MTLALAPILVACSTFALFRLAEPVLALSSGLETDCYSEFLVQVATNTVQKNPWKTVAQAL